MIQSIKKADRETGPPRKKQGSDVSVEKEPGVHSIELDHLQKVAVKQVIGGGQPSAIAVQIIAMAFQAYHTR